MSTTRPFLRFVLGIGVVSALSVATSAFAFPVGTPGDGHESELPSLSGEDLAAVDFTAIVALSNCSGSLVKFTTSKGSDFAMVLTNGHCIGAFIDPDDAVYHEPSSRSFSLLSSNGRSTLGTLRATQIMYATMTGTDLTLYKLNQTYDQIYSKYRVQPLVIANTRSDAGAPISVVSGYWRRIYSCKIDHFVYKLKEGAWICNDSLRYTQPGCETIGGTSGSPVVHSTTRSIIGINNTGNENGLRCLDNNPCEIDETGKVTYQRGAAYGQQVYQLYTCLNSSNDIDLDTPGCKLNKPL